MTEETGSLRSTRVSLTSSGRKGNRQQQHRQAVQQAGHAQVLLKSPAINRLLSAWFTILSAFAEPQTSKSAFALFVADRTLFSVTSWNSLPKSHPRRNCLGWAHWASHSNKSRDVGCWPTLRTSLSLQPKFWVNIMPRIPQLVFMNEIFLALNWNSLFPSSWAIKHQSTSSAFLKS